MQINDHVLAAYASLDREVMDSHTLHDFIQSVCQYAIDKSEEVQVLTKQRDHYMLMADRTGVDTS